MTLPAVFVYHTDHDDPGGAVCGDESSPAVSPSPSPFTERCSGAATGGEPRGVTHLAQRSQPAAVALSPDQRTAPSPSTGRSPGAATGGGPRGVTHLAQRSRSVSAPSQKQIHPNDFGHLISRKLGTSGFPTKLETSSIRAGLGTRWKPENKNAFPQSCHKYKGGVRNRRITPDHLTAFPWLAISHHEEHWGAWCANCVLMGGTQAGGQSGASNQQLGRLVTRPLRDFSDLTGRTGVLSLHNNTDYHRRNTAAAAEFLLRQENNQDVESIVISASKREVERNRAALASIIDTLKFAAMQNIALRGHRDDGRIDPSGKFPDQNDGNFRMLLRLRIQSGDQELQDHLRCAAGSALYTSKTIQNELLQDILQLITEDVSKKVAASPLWAILADETTDRAQREQLAVVVRYLDRVNGKYVVREDPITLIDVFNQLGAVDADEEVQLSGANISKVLLEVISRCRLDTGHLIAQCYDGAAAMASAKVGVAKRLQEVAPLAHYYHCAMHGLNLSTSTINNVATVRNALGTMETVIVFVTDSAKRTIVLRQAQKKTGVEQQRLIKLCQTRFVERHTSVQRFCEQLPAIVDALQMMTTWSDSKTSSKASTLLAAMSASEFFVGMVIAKALAGLLRPVSLKLQEEEVDLMQTLQLTRATIDALTGLRNDEKAFDRLMLEAQSMANELNVVLAKPRVASRSTCRANAGADENVSASEHYRLNVMLPAVDAVRCDMESRFGTDKSAEDAPGKATRAPHGSHHPQAYALSYILPKRVAGATWEDVRPGWELFQPVLPTRDESLARAEFLVWAAMWSRTKETTPVTAAATLDHCSQASFPTMHRLLQVRPNLHVI